MIDWRKYITTDKQVLKGKPIIKNTRLSVEFILGRLANGWTESEIFENYPSLSSESMKAVYAYAYECMKDGLLFMPKEQRA